MFVVCGLWFVVGRKFYSSPPKADEILVETEKNKSLAPFMGGIKV